MHQIFFHKKALIPLSDKPVIMLVFKVTVPLDQLQVAI
jgi:hypothetical protein